MLLHRLALCLCVAVGLAAPAGAQARRVLVWHDEFDGPAGRRPDPASWLHDVGTDWGNHQLEYDTDRTENASLDGEGHLRITARRESLGDRTYTSARLISRGLREFTYGRIEARLQLPRGKGLWPAFWLLGGDIGAVGWPACGEVDVMEYRGQEPDRILGTLHGPGYSGAGGITKTFIAPPGTRYDEGFHVFAVEWSPRRIQWFVDGRRYHVVRREAVPRWVFDHPFFIILNVAVGGDFLGPPDDTTVFPTAMVVDWVRVYAPPGGKDSARPADTRSR